MTSVHIFIPFKLLAAGLLRTPCVIIAIVSCLYKKDKRKGVDIFCQKETNNDYKHAATDAVKRDVSPLIGAIKKDLRVIVINPIHEMKWNSFCFCLSEFFESEPC